MRAVRFNDSVETIDRLAIVFGLLYAPTPNNGIDVFNENPNGVDNRPKGDCCQYILFHPHDFHYWLLRSNRVVNHFDRETQLRLIKRGTVGYLWGATVVLDSEVAQGTVVLSSAIREKVLRSEESIVVEMQTFDKIDVFTEHKKN